MAAPKKYKTNALKKSSVRTTAKKRPTSRVGSTKLAKKSFFKPWMALPIVAVVALVGYSIIQFSQASSPFYTDKNATWMRGGKPVNWPAPVGKIRLVEFGQSTTTSLTASQLRSSSKVCAWFYAGADNTAVVISVNGGYKGTTVVRGNQNGKPSSVCTQSLKLSTAKQAGSATVTVAAGRAGVKLFRIVKLGGTGSAPPASVPGAATNTGSSSANSVSSVANNAATAANTAASQAAAAQAAVNAIKNACNAANNYPSRVRHPIIGGTVLKWVDPYWDARAKKCKERILGAVPFTAICTARNYMPNEARTKCVKEVVVNVRQYAAARSFSCPNNQSWIKEKADYKGGRKYRCKGKELNKGKYTTPTYMECYDSVHYKAQLIPGTQWKTCIRR